MRCKGRRSLCPPRHRSARLGRHYSGIMRMSLKARVIPRAALFAAFGHSGQAGRSNRVTCRMGTKAAIGHVLFSLIQYGSQASAIRTALHFRHSKFYQFQWLMKSVLNRPSQQLWRELALRERIWGYSGRSRSTGPSQKPQESCHPAGGSDGRAERVDHFETGGQRGIRTLGTPRTPRSSRPNYRLRGPERLPNGVHFHAAWQGCSGFVSYPKIGPKRQFSYTVQQISIPQAIVIAQLSTHF